MSGATIRASTSRLFSTPMSLRVSGFGSSGELFIANRVFLSRFLLFAGWVTALMSATYIVISLEFADRTGPDASYHTVYRPLGLVPPQ